MFPPQADPITYLDPKAQVFQAYGSIEGVLTDDGLTVSLYVPDSGLKRFCPRFKDQELQITGEIPGNIHQLYDGFAGVTIEGLRVVIETHRCCTADSQVNASARKVCMVPTFQTLSDPLSTEVLPPCPYL